MATDDLPANPWLRLPRVAPYVLDEDRLAVEVFNADAPVHVRLHVDTCPEPFFGDPDAPIVVLLLNPGVSEDGRYDDGLHATVSGDGRTQRHFYIGSDNRWWRKLVSALARERPGVDVARRVLSVEFIAYRSRSFGCGQLRLPSQAYAFALVRRAIRRGAAVVIVRGERHWIGAVPELHGHAQRVSIVNPQSAALSARNLAGDGFARLLAALDHAEESERATPA